MRTRAGRAAAAAATIMLLTMAGCGEGPQQTGSDTPYLIKDIVPGPGPSRPDAFTLSGRFTYFRAFDATHGREIWRTDGTEAGTKLVADILPGPEGLTSTINLTDVNGTVFFTVTDPEHGTELWKTDGTAAGTVLVKDINPGPHVSEGPDRGSSYPSLLTNVNGRLFFVACDEEHGYEMWTSDGTEAGTQLVKDIFSGPGVPAGLTVCFGRVQPRLLTAMGGILYFLQHTPEFGEELWRSDGTPDGTYLVKDGEPGPDPPPIPNMGSAYPVRLQTAVLNGTLFFPNHLDMWKSDGTAEGTALVNTREPFLLTGSRDFVFFSSGARLWRSDGTAAGTSMVELLHSGSSGVFDSRFADMRGTDSGVFFDAFTPDVGNEPWFSDGTPEGTHLIADINPGSPSSDPRSAVWFDGKVYFFANDVQRGWQLWRADGAGEDLRQLTAMTIEPDAAMGSGPNGLVFAAGDLEHGVELWGFHPRAGN